MRMLLLPTDQTRCYRVDGREVACDGTGQDGALPKPIRYPWRNRFRAEGHIVHDRWTGAVWCRNANPADFPLTWDEAHAFVADMRAQAAHGYDTWQLPSRGHLFSLISHQNVNPSLPDGNPFRHVFHSYYWTGETTHRLADQAWYVHLGGGRVHRGMKHGSYMVWPVCPGAGQSVRAGPSDAARFVATGPWVHDAVTGLTWLATADWAGGRRAWDEALASVADCNRQRIGGFDDWRLPNIRELESLVDLGAHDPALSPGHPFACVREGYWSSTTSVYEARYAWVLYSMDGGMGVGFKPQADFHVWPVRSDHEG